MFLKLQTKSDKRRQAQKSWTSHDSGSESDGGSSENEKNASGRTTWRDTQECYRCRKVGQSAQYCPCAAWS